MPLRLDADATFKLVASSEHPGALHIDNLPHRIVVYAWAGCTIQVYSSVEQVHKFVGDFPDLPSGLSVRDFIDHVFGDQPPPAEGKAD